MRLGQEVTQVKVGDISLTVALTWADLKALLRSLGQFAQGDPETWEPVEDRLRAAIVGVEGLELEDGTPVREMTREVWERLPAKVVTDIMLAVADIGGAAGDETFREPDGPAT